MKRWIGLALGIVSVLLTCAVAHAGNAEVMMKGIWMLNVDYKHYLPWDKRFDKDGNVQDAATDFNSVLGTNVIPDLAVFEGPPFNVPSPNIGRSVVSFEYEYDRVETTIAYGITDKLTLGVKVPYIWYRNTVTANLDNTNANIGKNPFFNPALPPGPTNPPLIPTAIGGQKLSAEDVQSLLGGGLYINGGLAIPGYGFKRIQSWEESGIGDIESGMKYQYYKSPNWRLAFLGGVLFPTGEVDDPDNLVDQPLGGGSYALLFRSYNDYTGIRNLVLDASIFYCLTLQQERDKRIVTDPHQPLTSLKERVKIDPGDIIEFEASARYHFDGSTSLGGTSIDLLYHYTHAYRDTVKGQNDARVPSLEEETGGMEQYVVAGISYSTVPLYLKKEFPIPMDAYIGYRNKFAGTNSTFKTQYLQFGLNFYF